MLHGKLNRKTCLDLPILNGNTFQWRDGSHISVLNNPCISATLNYSAERWICVINILPTSQKNENNLKIKKISETGICNIYKEFGTLKSEGFLIELVHNRNGTRLRIIAANEGSIPIYFCLNGSIVNLNWDFREITNTRDHLILDFEYLVRSTFEPTYTNRTAFQGISMLTAGSSCIFSDDACEYRYPPEEAQNFSIVNDTSIDVSIDQFLIALDQTISYHLAESQSIAIELSGGLDSSVVAMACSMFLANTKISTYGIIVSESVAADAQLQRRSKILDFIRGTDSHIKIKDHLPYLTSPAPDRYHLNSEAYGEAFDTIWRKAELDGHHAILSGCGGDELFPHYLDEDLSSDRLRSISDEKWQLYKNLLDDRLSSKAKGILNSHVISCAPRKIVDTGVLLAMARRAPLLLSHNLIPLYPLRNNAVIKLCSKLPLKTRLNKTLLSALLNKAVKTNLFTDYPKETFMHADKLSLLLHKETYIKSAKNFKVLEIGLINQKNLLHDLSLLNRKTPRYVLDYLLNILAIERFLETYL